MDEKPRIARRLAWGVAAGLLLLGVIATAVGFGRRTVWTDGQSTRVAAPDARLREVLWAAAKPLQVELNSADQQYEPSLSPDGTELYFVRGKPGRGAHIYMSRRRDNAWTSPVRVDAVAGPTDELGPRVTHDGRFLIFSSDRPGGLGGYDLWAAPRGQGGWGAPFNLGPGVNTEFNELNPDPTPDGRRLIFSTNRKAAGGEQKQAWRGTIRETGSADYDLWTAALDRDTAAAVTTGTATTRPTTASTTQPAAPNLAFSGAAEIPGVNTSASEGASCLSPAGDFLYFASNRPGGHGKFDLYRCRVRDGGQFGPVENLGRPINTPDNEADPAMAFAGFRLYFSSDRDSPAGVYALYSSDSREVFAVREGRAFPRLGWSVWSLLLSALLLIPLILALRGIEGRHLNTLQRCLVLSLLLHAALTCVFSFVMVSRDVARAIRRGAGGEIALNFGLPRDVEIGLAVRGQLSSSSELPVTAADPAPVARATDAATATAAPPPVHISAPANTATLTTLSPPIVTIAAKFAAPTDVPQVSPAVPVANGAAASLPDVGPHDVAGKLVQAAPEAPATDVRPHPVTRATVADADEARPFLGVDSPVPKATPAGAAQTSIDVSPAGTLKNLAVPGDVAAVTPRAATLERTPDLPLAGLPTQDAPAPRLKPEKSAALPSSGAPSPAVARSQVSAATLTDNTAVDLATPARPVRPTTAPTGIALASAAAARPARIASLPSAADVQPSGTTTIAPALALAPLPPASPAPTSGKVRAPDVGADPLHGAEISMHAGRQPTANDPSAVPPPIGNAPLPVAPNQADSLARAPALTVGSTLPLPPVSPAISVTAAAVPLNLPPPAGVVATSTSPFPRSPEQRQARVEKLGGTAQSESAVDRGLAYLAMQQEPDGRWTLVLDDARPTGRRPRSYHDMANTGLAVLAFLARDHAPGKPGAHPQAVARALDYLIDQQDDDGDLRGPPHLRGEGSRRGDMYDHAIATLALAEAALMTGGDKRYTGAALRGARFIVAAQDPRSGGWRYVPGESGDSSVFGWQLMALHAAEQLGFQIPQRTRQLARQYVRLTSRGPRNMLAGYQPGRPPTPAMTAEILYSRMLLGEKLDPDDVDEATNFLASQPPNPREPSLYYWYYASLCMLQIQSPDWKRWNARTRDALIALQTRGGASDGSWDADPRYAERGGRVYMTSIAVLTLEVYYRYLPLLDRPPATRE